jgi:chaperonin GroES
MALLPHRDRILIRRDAADSKTPGGLFVPDSAKDKPAEGTVVAVGPGGILMDGTTCPILVREGDRVLFAKGAGTEVRDGEEDLLLVREAEILAIRAKA